MKRMIALLAAVLLLTGCSAAPSEGAAVTVAATTKPVYEFTAAIAEGTGISVSPLITEEVSCLHDYTLSVSQMQLLEQADAVIINGGGLEDFMLEMLDGKVVVDATSELITDGDPHVWLSPEGASGMAKNIAFELIDRYPEYQSEFRENLGKLQDKFLQLQAYAHLQTAELSCRKLITFHDGFSCFADALELELLASMEVEHGSEPTAKDLKKIAELVQEHGIPAVFVEVNGEHSSADVVAGETGCKVFSLDTAMGKSDYFTAMRQNIDTVKEALS